MSDPRNQAPLSGVEMVGLGLVLAAAVMIPLVCGIVVDAHFGSTPVGVAIGMLIGIVAAVVVVYVRFKRYS